MLGARLSVPGGEKVEAPDQKRDNRVMLLPHWIDDTIEVESSATDL
jgi:hypothetical protein